MDRPTGGERTAVVADRAGRWRRSRHLLPFALLAVAAIPLAYLPPHTPNTVAVVAAAAITAAAFAAAVALPWERLPGAAVVVPPLVYLLAIAVLRHAEGGGASGYGPLVLIPLFWVALHGGRGQVAAVAAGIAATFVAPILLVGPPTYPPTEWRRAAVWVVIAPTVGLLVNHLVGRIRRESSINERRARALDEVADVARALGHGADVRLRICRSALRISGGGASFLVEPDGGGRLRSTAIVGLDVSEIVVTIGEQPSALVTVYTSAEPLFIADARGDPRIHPGLAEATGATSLLLEPVARRGETVGVLAVVWTRRMAAPDEFSAMVIGSLAAEAAVAIERSDLLAQLERLARTDKLTGLPNRRAFDEMLEREMARTARTGEPLALALLDLDRFKAYNDAHGHPAGDELLREAARAWSERLREVDVLARWGGEEFAVLLPGASPSTTVRSVVERLRAATPSGQTCSAGIAVSDGREDADQLIARADAALYRAKEAGRDRSVLI